MNMMKQQVRETKVNYELIPVEQSAWLACKREPQKAIKQLKKLKSRAMVDAMNYGEYHKGNHAIFFKASEEDVFSYYYRGTLIALWVIEPRQNMSVLQYIHAGEFEGTTSTRQQRQEILCAILLFKEVYLL